MAFTLTIIRSNQEREFYAVQYVRSSVNDNNNIPDVTHHIYTNLENEGLVLLRGDVAYIDNDNGETVGKIGWKVESQREFVVNGEGA